MGNNQSIVIMTTPSLHKITDEVPRPLESTRFEMSYRQAITHRVEKMEISVNPNNPDT
jgi:hypothetical protein